MLTSASENLDYPITSVSSVRRPKTMHLGLEEVAPPEGEQACTGKQELFSLFSALGKLISACSLRPVIPQL